MNQFEVEVKVLLQTDEKARLVEDILYRNYAQTSFLWENVQQNFYYEWGKIEDLFIKIKNHIPTSEYSQLEDILFRWKKHSIRLRKANEDVIFIVKAVADDTWAVNGIARVEFEQVINASMEEIDLLILSAWFHHQSKWSRYRKIFQYKDFVVSLDKNAWYGRVAEFERLVNERSLIDSAKEEIRTELQFLGLEELPQDRLQRMFEYYSQRWPEYYGSQKYFTIE